MIDTSPEALMKQLTDELRPYVSMLLFIKGEGATPNSVTNNGTVSFVDTGKTKLLVTCAHVIESYREQKKGDRSVVLAIAVPAVNKVLDIKDEWIIDCGDERLDLATIKLPTPNFIEELGKKYFPTSIWPPSRMSEGTAEAAGFPGAHRTAVPGGLQANITCIRLKISSVSQRHFAFQIQETDQIVKMNPNLKDVALGGLSGSAVYFSNSPGIRDLVGFIYSGDWISEKEAIVYVGHADFIREDGKLNWSAVV